MNFYKPQWLRRLVHKFRSMRAQRRHAARMERLFRYDCERWIKWGKAAPVPDTDGKVALASIMLELHSIERAFCLPYTRPGFAQERVRGFMDMIRRYERAHPGAAESVIQAACSLVAEYKSWHAEIDYDLPADMAAALEAFIKEHGCEPSRQPEVTREGYWARAMAPFDEFARSRHSVRAFSDTGRVPLEAVKAAVRLANDTTPTACNRRQVRAYIVDTPELVRKVCALQKGNNGFGHVIDKMIVVTGCIRFEMPAERNDIYTNCGIYVMNLCYALHFHKVAHCCLNWSKEPEDDLALRELLGLPEDEVVALMVGCGVEKERFHTTRSPGLGGDELIKVL